MREAVAEGDARGSGFYWLGLGRAFEHAGLRGHVGESFYTGG
jgi:hypothetical protein